MAAETKKLFQFGTFRLDVTRRRLTRSNQLVPLTSKAFETLYFLVSNHDRVVVKDELMHAVWPDSFVEEVNLAQNISALRKVLGEAPGENRFIATIPGRGYRFVADLDNLAPDDTEVVVQRQTTATMVLEAEAEAEVEAIPGTVLDLSHALSAVPSKFLGVGTLAWLSLLAVVTVGAGALYLWRSRQIPTPSAPHTLAVLPFKPLTEQSEQYLGLGLTDAVISRLGTLRQLVVRPTSTVLRYADANSDPVQAGRALGVESVLDGKVQKVGDRIRVTVQMFDVKDGRLLWAETFDENFTNVFSVEDSISQRVVAALPVQLGGRDKQQLVRNYTVNAEAYQNYVKGRFAEFHMTSDTVTRAIDYFNRAIAIDPGYAQAYAGLADGYTIANDDLLPPSEAFPKAEAAARKALAIDDNLAEAHAALAHSLMHHWQLEDARKEFQRALELSPNNTAIYFAYGEYMTTLGRYDDAIASGNQALKLDPLSTEGYQTIAFANYLKRDFVAVLTASQKALEIDPNFPPAIWDAAIAHLGQGKYTEAIAEFRKVAALSDNDPLVMAPLAAAYARSGNHAEALKVIEELKSRRKLRYVPPALIAIAYGEIGEMDEAFAWMDKAYDDHSELMMLLNSHPWFDSLRSDPRFQRLVQKVAENTQKS